MKGIKKLIGVTLIIAMIFSLAACGGDKNTDGIGSNSANSSGSDSSSSSESTSQSTDEVRTVTLKEYLEDGNIRFVMVGNKPAKDEDPYEGLWIFYNGKASHIRGISQKEKAPEFAFTYGDLVEMSKKSDDEILEWVKKLQSFQELNGPSDGPNYENCLVNKLNIEWQSAYTREKDPVRGLGQEMQEKIDEIIAGYESVKELSIPDFEFTDIPYDVYETLSDMEYYFKIPYASDWVDYEIHVETDDSGNKVKKEWFKIYDPREYRGYIRLEQEIYSPYYDIYYTGETVEIYDGYYYTFGKRDGKNWFVSILTDGNTEIILDGVGTEGVIVD